MNKVRAEVRIKGRVQGVNFRNFVQQAARETHVAGWVKNLPDGDVGAVFEGSREAVDDLLRSCRRGPPAAAVEAIDIDWHDAQNEFRTFEIRY